MSTFQLRLCTLFVALFACSSAFATVWTINNTVTPVNPGQFSTLATAIADTRVTNGDTLLVAGSGIPYETATLTINKRLVIIGAGYNPKGATNATRIGQQVSLTCAASGSTLMGMEFMGQVYYTASGGTSHTNITFARNYFSFGGSLIGLPDSIVNNRFINNIFGINSYLNFFSGSTTLRVITTYFYNNVFLHPSTYPSYYTSSIVCWNTTNQNIIVDHNLFLFGSRSATTVSYSSVIGGIQWVTGGTANYSTITNNIFYNTAAFATSPSINNCILSNNITYTSTSQPTLPYSGSTGSGNINNTNPLLASIFNSSANPLDFNLDNIGLQSTSPCINAGNDGTNIGPTGGVYPIYNTNSTYLTGEPPLPSVRTITVSGSTTISTGGTLNVTVTGKKIN